MKTAAAAKDGKLGLYVLCLFHKLSGVITPIMACCRVSFNVILTFSQLAAFLTMHLVKKRQREKRHTSAVRRQIWKVKF